MCLEANWNEHDNVAQAAEKLALFLTENQTNDEYWPRAWHSDTGEIAVRADKGQDHIIGGRMSNLTDDQIKDFINNFNDGFNCCDLDFVMTYFCDDAIYVEFNGKKNCGKKEIRAAFEPQFRGVFGKMHFEDKDLIIDASSQKAMFNWWCVIENEGSVNKCDGVDFFKFKNGLILEKRTFMHCDIPKFIDY